MFFYHYCIVSSPFCLQTNLPMQHVLLLLLPSQTAQLCLLGFYSRVVLKLVDLWS